MTGSENYLEKPVEEDIDPNIKGSISPGCWQVFIDIAQRCLKHEPDERPTMHEVDLRLQHALLLQEQADISNPLGDYIIMSKTIINPHENIIKKVETDSYCMPENISDLEDTLRG
ncbi:hypothetical protein Fmac_017422 [Flemingia macrophylla]|uniref:Uncharacterized protein n=1 Tax=Flemingia macrophylla TaxID=520843 RepID=A0ABD1M291_9FABA